MMSIASLLSIKVTSPITHMVSSAVRGVAASLLGMWLFHDVITRSLLFSLFLLTRKDLINFFHNYSGRASSIAIILLGSILYTWVKHQESQPAAASSRKGSYERVKMDDIEAGEKETVKR